MQFYCTLKNKNIDYIDNIIHINVLNATHKYGLANICSSKIFI